MKDMENLTYQPDAAYVAACGLYCGACRKFVKEQCPGCWENKKGWDKSPSLLIVFGLSSKTQWLSGLYYADFISFYSPTQLCGGGTTKSNSNELPISVPLSMNIHCRMKGANKE